MFYNGYIQRVNAHQQLRACQGPPRAVKRTSRDTPHYMPFFVLLISLSFYRRFVSANFVTRCIIITCLPAIWMNLDKVHHTKCFGRVMVEQMVFLSLTYTSRVPTCHHPRLQAMFFFLGSTVHQFLYSILFAPQCWLFMREIEYWCKWRSISTYLQQFSISA